MQVLGIDIGGSGIKGALVDTRKGVLKTERHRIVTPKPATPKAVAATVAEIAKHFSWRGPIGCGFPGVTQRGMVRTAANIDKKWINKNAAKILEKATGSQVVVVNDADAAGLAEARFGAGRKQKGLVILITIGTGLGSAMMIDGQLVPNSELGHMLLHDDIAEKYASDAARERDELTWTQWGKRFNEYLQMLERLFSPDLFILGGGASKKTELYIKQLKVKAKIRPARLRNQAGIVGAALVAKETLAT